MIIPLKSNSINKTRAKLALITRKKIIPYITSLLYFFELIMIGIVYFYVKDYWENCPFFIYDDLNKHYNRRCELYNINHNSRYSYQYICSFDPSGPFKYETETHFLYDKKVEKKLRKKIQPDYLRCIRLNSLITGNEVIALFINEYKNSKNYYCSRTNKPKKNFSISDKDCKNKKKIILLCLYIIFSIVQFFLIICIPIVIGDKNPGFNEYNDYNRNGNIDNRNNNNNYNNYYNNNNNNNYNGNVTSNHLDSTIISNTNDNENFEQKNTKNIIVENGRELPISIDIQNINFENIDNKEIMNPENIRNEDIEIKNENENKEKSEKNENDENNFNLYNNINSMNNNEQINEENGIIKDDENNNRDAVSQINESKDFYGNEKIEKDNENKSEIIINNNEKENNEEINEKENTNNKGNESLLNKLFEDFEGENLSSTIKYNKNKDIEKGKLNHEEKNIDIPKDTNQENEDNEEDKKDGNKKPEDTKTSRSEDDNDDNI